MPTARTSRVSARSALRRWRFITTPQRQRRARRPFLKSAAPTFAKSTGPEPRRGRRKMAGESRRSRAPFGMWRVGSAKILAATVLIGLMTMATMASGAPAACSGYSLRIVDEAGAGQSPAEAVRLEDVADPNFKEFV